MRQRHALLRGASSDGADATQETMEEESKDKLVRAVRRLNVNLSAKQYAELEQLAVEQGASLTEIVKLGLALAFLAYTKTGRDRHLTISDNDGKPVERIIIPK